MHRFCDPVAFPPYTKLKEYMTFAEGKIIGIWRLYNLTSFAIKLLHLGQ